MIYFIGGNKTREFHYMNIIDEIRGKNENIVESFFDGDLKEENRFLEKISFNSIFSSSELIVLKRAEKTKNIVEILNYACNLELINKEIVIDYNQEDGKIGVKFKKELEKLEKENNLKLFLFSNDDEKDLVEYVQKELSISQRDAKVFLNMIGNNIYKVKNEVNKVKAYLLDEKFDLKKLKNIISVDKDFEIYEITNNIFEGNYLDTLDYLKKTKEYMGVLYSLYIELEIMLKIVLMKSEGVKFSSNYNIFKEEFEKIKEVFKNNKRIPNPYVIYKKFDRLKKYNKKVLKKLVYRAWEVEKDIKIGKLDMESGVENFILEIVNYSGK